MKKYDVEEIVREIVIRKRRWQVRAVSEHDAIRQIKDGDAAEHYVGESWHLAERNPGDWRVDDSPVEYNPVEAVPEEDDLTDIGGSG